MIAKRKKYQKIATMLVAITPRQEGWKTKLA